MEDKDFKAMMDEHEAGKTRGSPSGSHFAKMQNVTWGVKPNLMGKDKDWPMPANIPKADTKDEGEEHIEKADDIKETKDAESTDAGTLKPVSPLTGEGNLTKSADDGNGISNDESSLRSFKDIMAEKGH